MPGILKAGLDTAHHEATRIGIWRAYHDRVVGLGAQFEGTCTPCCRQIVAVLEQEECVAYRRAAVAQADLDLKEGFMVWRYWKDWPAKPPLMPDEAYKDYHFEWQWYEVGRDIRNNELLLEEARLKVAIAGLAACAVVSAFGFILGWLGGPF